jgi:prepilin-type N-terminal cleavage/methylation domain-containing protein/prepilin-type processing-associated H-X9-DG protein
MNTDEFHYGRGKARDCERAFTLIELLVVIATLAILAMWVMPALARSGDDGSRAVCYNNLRRMGTAVNLYASENQDGMAWPNWGNDASPPCPAGWLYAGNLGGPTPVVNWQTESTNRAPHIKTGVYWQYVPDVKWFVCPVDKPGPPPALWSLRDNKLSTYVMNGSPAYFPGGVNNLYGYRTAKINQVWSPLCYLLWEPDQFLSPTAYNDAASYPDLSEGVGTVHGTGGNILALDGHVDFISRRGFQQEQAKAVKNLLWWNPRTASGR